MSTPRFLYDDLGIPATITAATEDTDFPKENVQNELRTKVYKSTDLTDEWLVFDLGSAATVNTIAIMNHNFNDFSSVTPTIKFQGHTADSWGTPDVDETLTVVSGTIINYITGGSKRYWRVSMTGGSGTETTYNIGRVMFGAKLQPSKSYDVGFQRSINDFTVTSQTIGGQLYSDFKGNYDSFVLPFSMITTTDRDNMITMVENNRTAKNLVWTIDTTDTTSINATTYYGKFIDLPTFNNTLKTSGDERHSTVLNLRESL
jgi:hypothetical protein